jgi:hypothetical protein
MNPATPTPLPGPTEALAALDRYGYLYSVWKHCKTESKCFFLPKE